MPLLTLFSDTTSIKYGTQSLQRLAHVLEMPIFAALLEHKLRHTLKPLQLCRLLCLKALWIKYLMCCVTVHAYVLDNNEINQ